MPKNTNKNKIKRNKRTRRKNKLRKKIVTAKKKGIKINSSQKNKKDYIEIKSITPKLYRVESKKIFDKLKKNPKQNNLQVIEEENKMNFAIESIKKSYRSFSPKINEELISLKSTLPSNIFKCNDLLETNIESKCLDYTSQIVKDKLLKNLQASKHLDCYKFIAPKQYNSNCWFNTMFVTFFFSDKGRKFFRFMRQLMITGKKVNGEEIPEELAKVFFVFNKIIEASYNQDGNSNYKLIANYNTNYFIENIYNILLKKNIVTYKKNQSGNPIEYYISIIKYLNYNAINIMNIDITNKNQFTNIQNEFRENETSPEIIIVEIIDEDSQKIDNRPKEMSIFIEGTYQKYKLDSAILRDTSKQHFCSVLTCNGKDFSFDGASYSRLSPYNWSKNINKKTKWGFSGHTLKWSFMNSYQMLFYYKI